MPKGVYARPTPAEHYERNVIRNADGCWGWRGSLDSRGYARFKHGRRQQLAHRYAYATFVAPLEPEAYVCHHCDNPPCSRPDHLFKGSPADNSRDMVTKGRQAKGDAAGPRKHLASRPRGDAHHLRRHPELVQWQGESAPKAKLTAEQVRHIRALWAAGDVTQTALAMQFSVEQATISRIVLGKTWRHLL